MEFYIAALFIGVLMFAWYNASKARERAILHCRQSCQRLQLQMLDDSIVLQKISIGRSETESLQLIRYYRFDFSLRGSDRYPGYVHLAGHRLQGLQFYHPDGKIFVENTLAQTIH